MKPEKKNLTLPDMQTIYLSIAIVVLLVLIGFVGYRWYSALERAVAQPESTQEQPQDSSAVEQKKMTDEEVFARLRQTATATPARTQSDAEVFERLSAGPPAFDADEGVVIDPED